MSKGLIAFIVVACISFGAILFVFLKRSTDEEFKRVNESLKRSTIAIDSANKALIDSIKNKKIKIK